MQEAEESALDDILAACVKEGGSTEDQVKRALKMLQLVGVIVRRRLWDGSKVKASCRGARPSASWRLVQRIRPRP